MPETLLMSRLAIALILLLFTGCSKDKDGFTLIGKWKSIADYNGITAWGGCSCWEYQTATEQHIIEFRLNGSYTYTPSMLSSFSGCSGEYQRTSDSTLSWNKCGTDPRTFYYSYQAPFLVIEERGGGGPYKIKYRRL
jgi:hypothetical protein